jgi:hypothetical protein
MSEEKQLIIVKHISVHYISSDELSVSELISMYRELDGIIEKCKEVINE